jgi:hypothetical protein
MGFVTVLSGQAGPEDQRPSGEVEFALLDEEEGEIRARGVLGAEDYATAAAAHLTSDGIVFKATLRRLPRVNRVDGITNFGRVELDHDLASRRG